MAVSLPLPAIHTVRVSDAELEVKLIEAVRPRARTLVFLHEGLGSADAWGSFPGQLCDATGCRGLVYSRQGYGRSSAAAAPRPVSYLHREGLQVLPRLLAELEVEHYALVGHSDGASIALLHAGGAPRPLLDGLIVMAPHVFVEDCVRPAIEATRREFENGALRKKLQRLHGANTDAAFYGWCRTWLAPVFGQWNIEPYLDSIQAPMLTIQGARDEYASWAQVDAIAARAATQVVRVPGGHWPHRDQPALMVDRCKQFLATLSTGSPRGRAAGQT